MLKKVDDKRQPCLTPIVVLNLLQWCHSSGLHLYPCRRAAQWRYLDLQWYCTSAWWPIRLHVILYQRLFEIIEDMVQILLMLEVRFTHDSKAEDLFRHAPSGSEPSLFSSAW